MRICVQDFPHYRNLLFGWFFGFVFDFFFFLISMFFGDIDMNYPFSSTRKATKQEQILVVSLDKASSSLALCVRST